MESKGRARGEIAAVRAALASPVLAIDEWLPGAPEVRRAAQLLLHGVRELPLEEERFVVRCVVMLACNPPKAPWTWRRGRASTAP